MEYPKTENLYASNGEQGKTYKRGPEFGFKAPGVEQISRWLVTEKVDGTNMRVIFEPAAERVVTIAGRSDRAQIPPDLLRYMEETFTEAKLFEAFADDEGIGPSRAVLFGEGFGPGIQKAGSSYGGSKRFILFDVLVGDWWLNWENVVDVARKLDIPTVPVLAKDVTLEQAKTFIAQSELLPAGSEHIEGIVVRTDPYLFDGRGKRVMFKHKVRDYQ